MAKVKKEIMDAALIKLLDRINTTMPNNTYKFLLGGATGLMSIAGLEKINQALDAFADANGLIETEHIKTIYSEAFRASDGKLQIDLFNNPNGLLSLFVKPLTVTITKDDIDEIMKEVESNAVVNEVTLPKVEPAQK